MSEMRGLLALIESAGTLHAISDDAEQHPTFTVGYADQAPAHQPDTPQGPGAIKEHSS